MSGITSIAYTALKFIPDANPIFPAAKSLLPKHAMVARGCALLMFLPFLTFLLPVIEMVEDDGQDDHGHGINRNAAGSVSSLAYQQNMMNLSFNRNVNAAA